MKKTCHFCKKAVDNDDTFCFGCKINVCEKCDRACPMGKHEPEDHLEESDAESWDDY